MYFEHLLRVDCFEDFFDANDDLSLALSVRALADRFCIMDLLQRTEATLKYMLSEDGGREVFLRGMICNWNCFLLKSMGVYAIYIQLSTWNCCFFDLNKKEAFSWELCHHLSTFQVFRFGWKVGLLDSVPRVPWNEGISQDGQLAANASPEKRGNMSKGDEPNLDKLISKPHTIHGTGIYTCILGDF